MTLPNHDDDDDDDDLAIGLADFLDGDLVQIAGAAADSAGIDASLSRFSRLARLALIDAASPREAHARLAADLGEIAPAIGARAAAIDPRFDPDTALALAVELDREAALRDLPDLRMFADGLRLASMSAKVGTGERRWAGRIAHGLIACVRAARSLPEKTSDERRRLAELQVLAAGWCALAAGAAPGNTRWGARAADAAAELGALVTSAIGEAAVAAFRPAEAGGAGGDGSRSRVTRAAEATAAPGEVPAGHVIVARLGADAKRTRTRELTGGLEGILDTAVPLAPVPDLAALRSKLLAWYPQAADVIDTILDDLRGRETVRLRPTILVGTAGAGKSSFAALLAGELGVGLWRVDATQDAAVIAGTSRRWNSAEPSHPLLAIARAGQANPLLIIDELEKAPTRADNGRLWDQLLGLLEPATASAYPDPCLQVPTDLSQVSVLATANDVSPLPSPLRDRMRVLVFPEPGPEHLNALLARLLPDAAMQRRLDPRFVPPLDPEERGALEAAWRGGSVRLLQRYLDVILRARDVLAARH